MMYTMIDASCWIIAVLALTLFIFVIVHSMFIKMDNEDK